MKSRMIQLSLLASILVSFTTGAHASSLFDKPSMSHCRANLNFTQELKEIQNDILRVRGDLKALLKNAKIPAQASKADLVSSAQPTLVAQTDASAL